MLRLMLRGEDIDTNTALLGQCREKIRELHTGKNEPWARKVFDDLAGVLGKGVAPIKYIEIAHHATGAHFGMTEAVDVQKYWTATLRPTLERAFRIVREHRALHGGLTALHALPPSVTLPEGHKTAVRGIALPVIGSAAALSDGKAADGCVELNIDGTAKEVVEPKDHFAFRLAAATLEPVARPGDMILVREHQVPTPKSLVVALSDDRLLARRLEIADNHSDVAVLTANDINPRKIAAPVVAKLSTLNLNKVVGVLYGSGHVAGKGAHEFCDCSGEADVKGAFANMHGLVTVQGQSAEPHALNGQYLIIAKQVPLAEALATLDGSPIIAEDSDGHRYFKRLRAGAKGFIILESLEIGGDYGPILLAEKHGADASVAGIWPVLGVLFEKP
jgi:SOS-response transcriptional repressor LexA